MRSGAATGASGRRKKLGVVASIVGRDGRPKSDNVAAGGLKCLSFLQRRILLPGAGSLNQRLGQDNRDHRLRRLSPDAFWRILEAALITFASVSSCFIPSKDAKGLLGPIRDRIRTNKVAQIGLSSHPLVPCRALSASRNRASFPSDGPGAARTTRGAV